MGSQTALTEIVLTADKQEYTRTDDIIITAEFKIQGDLRDSFNEKNWTESYNKFDNLFKLKYGVKVFSGGFRKRAKGSRHISQGIIFLDSQSKTGKSTSGKTSLGASSKKL